jgi:hypothetical protein
VSGSSGYASTLFITQWTGSPSFFGTQTCDNSLFIYCACINTPANPGIYLYWTSQLSQKGGVLAAHHNSNPNVNDDSVFCDTPPPTISDCNVRKMFTAFSSSDNPGAWPTTYSFADSINVYVVHLSAGIGPLFIGTWTNIFNGVANVFTMEEGTRIPGDIWTGMDANGGLNTNNCNGWTSSSSGVSGETATYNTRVGGWYDYSSSTCDQEKFVLCACIKPT